MDKKFKNILKGYMSRFEITEVNVITEKDVVYSGSPEHLLNPVPIMQDYADLILNSAVEKVMNFNDEKLFLFLNETI